MVCAVVSACTAVGQYFDTVSNSQGLIETLSGGAWSAIEAPLPAGAFTDPEANLVSAASLSAGTACAGGLYDDAQFQTQGLLECISAPPPPAPSCSGFCITTSSPLPNATVGSSYSTTIQA